MTEGQSNSPGSLHARGLTLPSIGPCGGKASHRRPTQPALRQQRQRSSSAPAVGMPMGSPLRGNQYENPSRPLPWESIPNVGMCHTPTWECVAVHRGNVLLISSRYPLPPTWECVALPSVGINTINSRKTISFLLPNVGMCSKFDPLRVAWLLEPDSLRLLFLFIHHNHRSVSSLDSQIIHLGSRELDSLNVESLVGLLGLMSHVRSCQRPQCQTRS